MNIKTEVQNIVYNDSLNFDAKLDQVDEFAKNLHPKDEEFDQKQTYIIQIMNILASAREPTKKF
jgi:TATA-box binding protein (TBP) (component of TFIID and TFIIIB)